MTSPEKPYHADLDGDPMLPDVSPDLANIDDTKFADTIARARNGEPTAQEGADKPYDWAETGSELSDDEIREAVAADGQAAADRVAELGQDLAARATASLAERTPDAEITADGIKWADDIESPDVDQAA